MYKLLILMFMFFPILGFSQARLGFQKADSLTYQYYLKGEWNRLITLSNVAFNEGVDSKFMRQRAGYAYFMTGDYTSAGIQYEKALTFDQHDDLTKEYLYYSALNSGSEKSRFYAGKLSAETKFKLGIVKFKSVDYVDTEFSLKTNQTTTRSNQNYYRFGIQSDLGYAVSLYQGFSYYDQIISNVLTRQPEYVAILKWNLNSVIQIKGAYHHLFTKIGNQSYPGNLGLFAVSTHINRFTFEANASFLKASSVTTKQVGLQAGMVLPGKSTVYFTGSLVGMSESKSLRAIYSQTAGLKISKNLWTEGNITLGNLKNYNTFNSLYVYNSVDPTVFRSGISLIYFIGKHLSVLGNFTFDQQKINNSATNNYYYQYSYSGGLKWKL
ncbi:MAG: hypothetical protein M0R39_05870 [Prolixibacteraceae bacterium]|nr:hypothetical protein [Prolixibacteraceae bacterium]